MQMRSWIHVLSFVMTPVWGCTLWKQESTYHAYKVGLIPNEYASFRMATAKTLKMHTTHILHTNRKWRIIRWRSLERSIQKKQLMTTRCQWRVEQQQICWNVGSVENAMCHITRYTSIPYLGSLAYFAYLALVTGLKWWENYHIMLIFLSENYSVTVCIFWAWTHDLSYDSIIGWQILEQLCNSLTDRKKLTLLRESTPIRKWMQSHHALCMSWINRALSQYGGPRQYIYIGCTFQQ